MTFPQRIASLRISSGLSQEKLSEQLGMSQRTVAAWECGERFPKFDMLCRLADFFNVSVDYMLGRTDIPNIYLDTKKDPSPIERERAEAVAEAAREGRGSGPSLSAEDRQWFEEQIGIAVDRALDRRGLPTGDPSESPDHS